MSECKIRKNLAFFKVFSFCIENKESIVKSQISQVTRSVARFRNGIKNPIAVYKLYLKKIGENRLEGKIAV